MDPTKLKRAGFIGAASGYFLATLTANDAEKVWLFILSRGMHRAIRLSTDGAVEDSIDGANQMRFFRWYERTLFESMGRFFEIPSSVREKQGKIFALQDSSASTMLPATAATGDGRAIYRRNPAVKGTMGAFGYDYFIDKYGEERSRSIRLLRFQGLRGSGGEYAYEVLNLTDGKRSVQQIRDAVSAIYGPVLIEMVLEYLRALEAIKVVRR